MSTLIVSTIVLVHACATWMWFESTWNEFTVVLVPFATVMVLLWLAHILTPNPDDTPWRLDELDFFKDRVS